jgi:hypothetical protein
MSDTLRLLVKRDNLRETRIEDAPDDAVRPLERGQARLRIEHFALTANNISYAVSGDALKYWQFFPAPQGWGCVPVWGFATVAESACEGVTVGERVYGYLPMATHLVVQPVRIGPGGFADGAAHRAELAPIYNQLTRCAADPGYRADREAEQALLRPLFVTSFLIDDFFAEAGFFGAQQVLLSSASSKTAYGTAFCLSRRTLRSTRTIGLTSAGNLGFTRSLGCYDDVIAYDAIASLPKTGAVYIDMSGDIGVRRAVHEHFGDLLAYSCAVGATHWQAMGKSAGLPGPKPEFFFAPAQAKKRSAPPPEGWGAGGLMQRIGESWNAFMQPVTEGDTPWLRVVRESGVDAMRARYAQLLEGRTRPREGHVLSWR